MLSFESYNREPGTRVKQTRSRFVQASSYEVALRRQGSSVLGFADPPGSSFRRAGIGCRHPQSMLKNNAQWEHGRTTSVLARVDRLAQCGWDVASSLTGRQSLLLRKAPGGDSAGEGSERSD